MKIVIIDYGMGNLKSVYNAFIKLGFDPVISNDKKEILTADKVVLPGVGAFKDAINEIKKLGLDEVIPKIKAPFLGICLGLQLLFTKSYEYGEYNGLNILEGEIVPFKDPNLKIPHMGWNELIVLEDNYLLNGLNGSYVYFVHSYYALATKNIIGYTNYPNQIAIAFQKDNFYALQFHPEKSGDVGLEILKRFGEL